MSQVERITWARARDKQTTSQERGPVSRILFPAPPPSYGRASWPQDLIWIPRARRRGKGPGAAPAPGAPAPEPSAEDRIPCLLLTCPSARFLVIYFHSNAEDLGRCRGFCRYLRQQFQVHVLAVEYPGYGACPGIASGDSVMENALSAAEFARGTLKWPLDSTMVFGRSIGTGPATALASMFRIAGLILVTPFMSIRELFRDRVGPLAGLVEEWFPNCEAASKVASPTLIIHGQRDQLISCRHGEAIYERLRGRKLLVSPPDMEHNTNLLSSAQLFVAPMFQFFALPGCAGEDMDVPAWAYDRLATPEPVTMEAEAPFPRLRGPTGPGGAAPPAERPPPANETEAFIQRWDLDKDAACALLELAPDLQRLVLERGDLKGARNPSRVILSRIRTITTGLT